MKGFSTLEMLIAMTILVLAVTAVSLLFPGIQAGGVDAETSAEALSIAQKMLENEQALGRKDFKLVVASSSALTSGGIAYQTSLAASSTGAFTKQITATVSWGALWNRQQKVTLSTVASDFQNVIGGDTCSSILTGNWSAPSLTTKLLGTDIMGDSSGTYPITDIDAYQGRLYVTTSASVSTVGPKNPAAASDSSFGTVAWASPTANLSSGQTTTYLKMTNLGFALPADATILGLQIDLDRKNSSSSNTVKDAAVRIVRSNGTIAPQSITLHSGNWGTGLGHDSYGGTTSLWGESTLFAKRDK